ncbi:glycosyltransferase [Methylobacterium frigidaeris]|uniref:Cellulose synthase catalytic subunit [UDP-forming] n=1 Tax=Methylobacterium frigidaeris TaxID=2038277 RepID=A0AA37H6D9_9HYPH|nr:glycosyltransferase [Methylobacterium frigidaeris]PIK74619.1 Curdlan synthase [Methylobacterium frigidaeris]GJD60299.1 Cellulose synthase catalytic subunit [UDP-forming] [Methylobacterium frigidaeris]
MVQHLLDLAPTLFVVAFFFLFSLNWPRKATWSRAITCLVVLAVALRYLAWRFFSTVLPHPVDGSFGFFWAWFVFLVELGAFADILLFLVAMSRYVDRSAEADRREREFFARDAADLPTVDVFIPTYNEPIDVLERTIVGALALDYPRDKLKVYVLDDKRRDWLRDYCESKGAIHVTRPDNSHAKAGNMNNGLTVSSGEFIAIFDADFVPYRNFLRRTVPFFEDPTIGIVQTPQHFFNKDPVQSNLSLEKVWPDEQRLFFDEMAASRDAWDVSFCCGSCSIARRSALDEIGGFPHDSITEDLLTTLALLNRGYKTRYLNERLSMGLAAENLKGYFVQRGRWCRGGIQTIYLHNGPLRGPGLTLFQRFMFLPLSWLVQYTVRFVILVVPAVYLWTGAAPLYFTGTQDIVWYQLPVLAAYFLLMGWLTPTRYLPLISSAVGAFATFRMLPVVISSLVKPFGVPFRVTPKGSGNEESEFDAYTFFSIAFWIAVTALGLVVNVVPEWSRIGEGEFSVVSAWWAVINIAVLMVAALICFEKPRPLLDSFATDEAARIEHEDAVLTGRITSLSLEGGIIELDSAPAARAGDAVTVEMERFPHLRGTIEAVSRLAKGGFALKFSYRLEGECRDRMIVKLYTGQYSQDIHELDKSAIASGLWSRMFGRTVRATA